METLINRLERGQVLETRNLAYLIQSTYNIDKTIPEGLHITYDDRTYFFETVLQANNGKIQLIYKGYILKE